jgi:hypothetical protein
MGSLLSDTHNFEGVEHSKTFIELSTLKKPKHENLFEVGLRITNGRNRNDDKKEKVS